MVVVRGTRQVSEIIVLSIEMVAVVVLEIRAKQEKLHVPMGPWDPRSHSAEVLLLVKQASTRVTRSANWSTCSAKARVSVRLASLRIVSFAD